MKSVFLSFLFFFCILAYAHAETSLGEVSVQANNSTSSIDTPQAQHDSVAFTQVLTQKDFQGRKTSLTETLQEVGGIQTKRYGGLDDFATISIRGSTSEQVAIYVDGIPLNQGIGGGVNIANIPTDQIERVEIYKGSAPAIFGSSSIGGVVNIITKKASQKWSTQITQSYGSFNTYEAGLNQSGHFKKLSHQLGYQFQHSDGDFSYYDNNGTPFNTTDDRNTTRVNNAFDRHTLITKITYPFSDTWKLQWNNQFFTESRGIPGLATLTSTTSHFSTLRNGTSFDIKKSFSQHSLTLTPYFQFLQEKFQDPNGEIGLGIQDNRNRTLQYGNTLSFQTLIAQHQNLTTSLHYRGEQFLPEDFSTSTQTPKSIRNQLALSLEDEIFLLNEKMVLNPSIRTEHIFNDFSTTSNTLHPVSGKIGIKYNLDSVWTARTNFSRGYRLPNFSELFGDRGAIVGNPSLRPESSWNWDIGLNAQWKNLRVETGYFLNHVNDLIQFLQTSQYTVTADNLSKARIQGMEVTLLFLPFSNWPHLDLSQNYTFQDARNTSDLPGLAGNFLPGRPMHQWNSKTTLHNDWGKFFVETSFMDSNYLDSQNILRVEKRLFVTSGASVTFFKNYTASIEAKNLLNERVADVVGFPLPGRSVYGKIEIKI